MATPTETLIQLISKRQAIEAERERIDQENIQLDTRRAALAQDFDAIHRNIAITAQPDSFVPGSSVRKAVHDILLEAGQAGVEFQDIRKRVTARTNKGSEGTVRNYLERNQTYERMPNSDRWRLR